MMTIEVRRIRKRRTSMNEDRVVGTARNLGGKAEEGLGRVRGDVKMQAEGVINQAAGTAKIEGGEKGYQHNAGGG
jgi:uncharacterized protein YjbJ (UPF0337 family)